METIIGILGGRTPNCTPGSLEMAQAIGEEIAKRGMALVCGGGDGIMEAACRGCKLAGGTTIGIMKWHHADDANSYVDYAIPTSMDIARNNVIIWTAAGLIAFDGRYGTASEIGVTLDVGKPLVVTGTSRILHPRGYEVDSCIYRPTNDPAEAASIVDDLLELITRDGPSNAGRELRNGRF